ncbi:MAG: 50S ribosomal protein L24 [bacterium]|nr:50S ribosomal protein L24 [bacterium]
MKIKKGDKVRIISGKDKGKSGVVLRALPKENKVIVEGTALYKRHMKGSAGKVGRIIEKSRPTNVSNVALISTPKIKSSLESSTKGVKK